MVQWYEKNLKTLFKGETNMFPQLTAEVQAGEVLVEMNTTMGAIKLKLFPEKARKQLKTFRSCKIRLL